MAVSVGLFAAVVLLGDSIGWSVGFLAFLIAFWFVGVEGGILPALIERILLRRAGSSREPVESIWFVDLDLKAKRGRDQFIEDTRDNPTIR